MNFVLVGGTACANLSDSLHACEFTHLLKLFHNWESEASPTLGCSIEISRDIYIYMLSVCLVCQIDCVGGIT